MRHNWTGRWQPGKDPVTKLAELVWIFSDLGLIKKIIKDKVAAHPVREEFNSLLIGPWACTADKDSEQRLVEVPRGFVCANQAKVLDEPPAMLLCLLSVRICFQRERYGKNWVTQLPDPSSRDGPLFESSQTIGSVKQSPRFSQQRSLPGWQTR